MSARKGASFLAKSATSLVAAALTYGALSAAARLSTAAGETGEVKGTVDMTDKVRARAGTVLVLLEPKDPATKIAGEAKRHVVRQHDAKFDPAFIVIAKGDTVEFKNDETQDLEHNVYSFSEAKKFDLGLFGKKSDKNSVTFDKSGEVAVYCSIHKFMEGTVYVAPTPFFAVADARSGEFKIASVPSGEWKARTWSSSKRYANEEAALTVKAGETAEVALSLGRRQ